MQKGSVIGYADGQYLTKIADAEPGADGGTDTEAPTVETGNALYIAKVTGVKTGLNFRRVPDMSAGNTIALLPNGTEVAVLKEGISGFSYVAYEGDKGYVTASYLTRV